MKSMVYSIGTVIILLLFGTVGLFCFESDPSSSSVTPLSKEMGLLVALVNELEANGVKKRMMVSQNRKSKMIGIKKWGQRWW